MQLRNFSPIPNLHVAQQISDFFNEMNIKNNQFLYIFQNHYVDSFQSLQIHSFGTLKILISFFIAL
jgi:hypothetical protein